jgi:hypothetical protein
METLDLLPLGSRTVYAIQCVVLRYRGLGTEPNAHSYLRDPRGSECVHLALREPAVQGHLLPQSVSGL